MPWIIVRGVWVFARVGSKLWYESRRTNEMVMGPDVGWAGSFVPMIVSETTLAELRNLAGPPPTPGMKMFEVNLESGQAKWKVWKTPSYSGRRRRRR